MTELEHFRAQKDAFFKTHPQSPLTDEQQATFTGLRYFPENPELRLVLPLEEFAEQDTVVMQTSNRWRAGLHSLRSAALYDGWSGYGFDGVCWRGQWYVLFTLC